jgi:hypothetical protein
VIGWLGNPKRRTAVRIWLGILAFWGAIAAYEIAAVQNLWGLHTISHWAYQYQAFGWAIFVAIQIVALIWLYHFHQPHPQ